MPQGERKCRETRHLPHFTYLRPLTWHHFRPRRRQHLSYTADFVFFAGPRPCSNGTSCSISIFRILCYSRHNLLIANLQLYAPAMPLPSLRECTAVDSILSLRRAGFYLVFSPSVPEGLSSAVRQAPATNAVCRRPPRRTSWPVFRSDSKAVCQMTHRNARRRGGGVCRRIPFVASCGRSLINKISSFTSSRRHTIET